LSAVGVHELLYDHAPWHTWTLVFVLIWPLVWRRRAPLSVLTICLFAGVLLWLNGTFTVANSATLVALYSVAAHRDLRRAVAAALVVEVGVVLLAVRFAPAGSVNDAVLLLSGLAAAAFFLGTTFRAQRRYLASADDRARRFERDREQQAQLAAAAERTRIAREMHDIVAHGLAVVITLAEGAASSATKTPESAQQTMRQVAAAGREALTEMRKLLEVLRTDDGLDHAPQPTLLSLQRLVEDVRKTGLPVDIAQSGDQGRLSPIAQATIFRIVQESLTNILKHANDASHVSIHLRYEATVARFSIQDHGNVPDDVHGGTPGNGIAGMRDRVAMFGGTVQAGPSSGGWLVSGEIPVS
jgi:signal transduction histidine kinase